ncbi:MAG: FliI/YscN family ATPase [Nitrospirota bacterium]
MKTAIDFGQLRKGLDAACTVKALGLVSDVVGLLVEVGGISPFLGEMCLTRLADGRELQLEVVGFRRKKALMMPLGFMDGVAPGARVEATGVKAAAMAGPQLKGRVVDGMGRPMDGLGELPPMARMPLSGGDINPLRRKRITEPLDVGVRAINALIPLGKGQRIGIMAGSGVGKSVLLGMMARYTKAGVSVIALIGERGREVREFIEKDLGAEGLSKSVVVVATSDQPPLLRLRAAHLATTYAEYFRDKGEDVLLMMDSATRVAMAQREVGLAAGEPPTTKGYTPSVFALLPKLLERAGNSEASGSITGIYTVLVEGDDMNDPVGDTMRSLLDGHIVLSRDLASRGHYPAIDLRHSVSRLMNDIAGRKQLEAAGRFLEVLSEYAQAEDLINIGAYKRGSNPKIDLAIDMKEKMDTFLRQRLEQRSGYPESLRELHTLFDKEAQGKNEQRT